MKKQMPSIQQYNNRQHFAEQVAKSIYQPLSQALSGDLQAKVSVGLSGGNTPIQVYQQLSAKNLAWSRIQAIVCDERIVDSTSEDFNGRMIATSLLQNQAQACTFIPFDLSQHSLSFYAKKISTILPLDVCVLGMGTDCHSASIFHDAENLQDLLLDREKEILLKTSSPRMPQQRVTLTMPVLQQSKSIHLLIQGEEKFAALQHALTHQCIEHAPILGVASLPQTTIHYCL